MKRGKDKHAPQKGQLIIAIIDNHTCTRCLVLCNLNLYCSKWSLIECEWYKYMIWLHMQLSERFFADKSIDQTTVWRTEHFLIHSLRKKCVHKIWKKSDLFCQEFNNVYSKSPLIRYNDRYTIWCQLLI